jgi:Fe-S-cluster-containing dehydrogenase component
MVAIHTVQCRICDRICSIKVRDEDLKRWKSGVHIQDAMPDLSAGDRELLISQTCNECWNKMFPPPDDAA